VDRNPAAVFRATVNGYENCNRLPIRNQCLASAINLVVFIERIAAAPGRVVSQR
jgi:hypothetical protein